MIVFTNVDKPGVVGFIGTLLGKNSINIAAFQVGRKQAGGEAVSILNVDSPVPSVVMDEIIYYRQRSQKGFTSLVEMIAISPRFTATVMADIADVLDVTSNVFTITSRGWSEKTGTEVQLIVVVDRSTLPVRILEYREQ